MQEYKCNNCGGIFYEDDIRYDEGYDMVEWWGSMVRMPWLTAHCPYCGDEDFKEKEDDDEDDN